MHQKKNPSISLYKVHLFFVIHLFFEARAEIQTYFCPFLFINENFKIFSQDLLTFSLVALPEIHIFIWLSPSYLRRECTVLQGGGGGANVPLVPFQFHRHWWISAHFNHQCGTVSLELEIGDTICEKTYAKLGEIHFEVVLTFSFLTIKFCLFFS